SYTWFAIFGPKGLYPVIAQKFNAAIKLALDDPETQKKLAELGNTPRYETIEQFKATVKRDRAKWAEVVKAVGAKIDSPVVLSVREGPHRRSQPAGDASVRSG